MFNNIYRQQIITENKNKLSVEIKIVSSKLYFCWFFLKDFFKVVFKNNYTLSELKETADYYRKFNNLKDIINEFSYNIMKEKNYIKGNGNHDNEIRLIILFPNHDINQLILYLKKK